MREMRRIVILGSNPQVQKYATKALDIQDACNSRPVVALLLEVMDYFRNMKIQKHTIAAIDDKGDEVCGTDIGLQNPIVLTILCKLNDLAGMEQSRTECISQCIDLKEGNDTWCDVHFLV